MLKIKRGGRTLVQTEMVEFIALSLYIFLNKT